MRLKSAYSWVSWLLVMCLAIDPFSYRRLGPRKDFDPAMACVRMDILAHQALSPEPVLSTAHVMTAFGEGAKNRVLAHHLAISWLGKPSLAGSLLWTVVGLLVRNFLPHRLFDFPFGIASLITPADALLGLCLITAVSFFRSFERPPIPVVNLPGEKLFSVDYATLKRKSDLTPADIHEIEAMGQISPSKMTPILNRLNKGLKRYYELRENPQLESSIFPWEAGFVVVNGRATAMDYDLNWNRYIPLQWDLLQAAPSPLTLAFYLRHKQRLAAEIPYPDVIREDAQFLKQLAGCWAKIFPTLKWI